MTKMNIDSTLIYWHNLNKLYEMLREELLKKFGISSIEGEILVYLAFRESFGYSTGDTAKDISENRFISKSNVSKGVYSLTKKGFIIGEQDAGDRRVIHLKLSPTADRNLIISEVSKMNETFNRLISRDIPREELLQLIITEKKLADNAAYALENKLYIDCPNDHKSEGE